MKILRRKWWLIGVALTFLIFLVIFGQMAASYALNLFSSHPSNLILPQKTLHSGSTTGFVTRSGTRLLLNGQPFRFAGANIHWLALDDSTTYPSQFRVNDALDAAKEMGLTVIRAHSLGISVGCPNCIEPSPGVFNQVAFQHTDYAIKVAGELGLRVIIPLTDNWRYATGGKHTFTDWRGISDENQFYSNPQVIGDFETYIRTLLNHVNVYTGIAYKDDPTILAWETGNELQPPTGWTETIAAYIKSIDTNHLVIDGRVGIDPNAARLAHVDILSNHYYPKDLASTIADANAAAKAGKAFIVGEFDWNDADGGTPLNEYLAGILANPHIAGDMLWELWSHDDEYGYTGNEPQYTLHYPGDTPAMRTSVQFLRSYAYKMRDQAEPPDSTPGAPWLETVVRNGTSNTLVWRGVVGAASYSIERSTTSVRGPWSMICNRCATDNDTPWVDKQVPSGPLWYRVIANNVSGRAGPPSDTYQAGAARMLIDNLNDWSHVYQHSENLTFVTSDAQHMQGDTSRVQRTSATHEFITWKQVHMTSFQAITYYWPTEAVSPFSIYTSADGIHWRPATPGIVTIRGDWQQYIYTLQGLSGVNYVKLVWNNLKGQDWNPVVGAVSILS